MILSPTSLEKETEGGKIRGFPKARAATSLELLRDGFKEKLTSRKRVLKKPTLN
jgi:hypothetical protein